MNDSVTRRRSSNMSSQRWLTFIRLPCSAIKMGFKNPTSSSCEDMIISIHLPGESHQNIDLKILKDSLTLVSPRFYLQLPLPHPVDPQKGNAKWDSESQKLIVTLRMDRELDLVNF